MPEFSAQRLAEWTGGRWTAQPVPPLSGFTVDSRLIQPGQVFVALKTDKRDGHDFIAAAAAAGAVAAIVARADASSVLPQLVVPDPLTAFQTIAREHRRLFRGRVIGISGSAGKTSTKDLLALLLGGVASGVTATGDKSSRDRAERAAAATGRVLATEGNLNNHLGVPLTLTRIDDAHHDFAVIEAGISAPGEMTPLAEMIEPDVAIITLIAPAHTQELGGLEGVATEKARLPAATRRTGVAVFSRDTADYGAFRELGVRRMVVERADVLRPAEPANDVVYFTCTHREDATAVSLAYGAPPPVTFTFRRVSDGMAQNAALAICAALWLGLAPATIQARLAGWAPARLRGEIRRDAGRMLYIDCYNANPASMTDALAVFSAIAPATEPRLYVIGSMEELGGQSAHYHRELGRSLPVRDGDRVYFVGAQAAAMRDGAAQLGGRAVQCSIAGSTDELVPVVRAWKGPIFIKGSRRYQLERILNGAESASAASAAGH